MPKEKDDGHGHNISNEWHMVLKRALTNHQKHKLEGEQRSKEQEMLNITRKNKTRNEITRSKTKEKDIIENAEHT